MNNDGDGSLIVRLGVWIIGGLCVVVFSLCATQYNDMRSQIESQRKEIDELRVQILLISRELESKPKKK